MRVKPFGFDRRARLDQSNPAFSAMLGCQRRGTSAAVPAGAGTKNSFPSVKTPSTSNRISLILLARAFDIERRF